ncbi:MULTISPECIES: hypothetical protein [unclassified Clostridium]|uniref:hypothetical protein n=1 Tax=unclassified Clostridium TaxID=2614128 RepID=UPI000297A1DE|nr:MULTISPECIES: hypothetical protein [unclassified Clostridium]EKQ56088.1 MAG: hypothetical protein A370_02310 [Clostridium sp. Maddingley MBC34-26]
MGNYPKEIENFHNTILKLMGVVSIESGIDNLEEVNTELLQTSQFSHLPHVAILRTKGGLKNEVLIQFEFSLDNSGDSLRSLEFLAWFIRDSARGGTKIQLRPFALPPVTPNGRQLGTTLKFHIDLFIDGIEETLEPAFKVIEELNKNLNLFIEMYDITVKE